MLRVLVLAVAVVISCCGLTLRSNAQSQDIDTLNRQVGQLYNASDYAAALPLAEDALKLSQQLPPDHLSTATAYHNLGEIYRASGRPDEAEPLMLKALDIRARVLGPDDPSYILTLSNLGGLYVEQRRYEDAERRFQQAIDTQLRSPRPNGVALGRSFNNLAHLYRTLERNADAEQLYRLAITVLERVPPSHALSVALDNLGELHQSMLRGVEAEPLFKRSLRIARQVTSPKHESVGVTLCHLAALYTDQGRYEESEALNARCIEILENAVGRKHRFVAAALNNRAELLRAQGRDEEAEPIHLRALDIRRNAVHPSPLEIAQSLNNLAALYQALDRDAEAERDFKRAIEMYEGNAGSDSQNLARALNNLAELYRAQGRYAEAEPRYLRSMDILEGKFGPNDQTVAVVASNMAGLFWAQQRFGEAEPLYLRTIEIFERYRRPDHPYVAQALSHLADFYQQLGRADEEAKLRQRLDAMPPAGTRHVPLYFGTNRKASGETFGAALSKTTTLGRVVMRVPSEAVQNRAKRIGENLGLLDTARSGELTAAGGLELVEIFPAKSTYEFANEVLDTQTRSTAFRNQALIFIHGYNNSFDAAMKRATQLAFDLQFDGILIPFTWPSQGGVLDYADDAEMASKSIDSFVAFIDDLTRTLPQVKLHLLAHSMGNQVMLRAMCKIAKRSWEEGAGRYNFGQVISAHADVDYDDFEVLTKCFRDRVEGITLYVNEGDTALSVRCTGFRCRAGNWARGYTVVDVVDTTPMSKGFWGSFAQGFDHDVFVRNPLLFSDITRLLLTGQRPVDARTPEFRPAEDSNGKRYWVYDKSLDPAGEPLDLSEN